MATFAGTTTLGGTLDPDTDTFTTDEVLNMPTHATGDFAPGGSVSVPEYDPPEFTYVGYGPDGWIDTSATWGTVYFSKGAFADAPASFTYETGAFPYFEANVTAGGTIDPDTLTFTVDEVTNMPTAVLGDFSPGGILSVPEYDPPEFDYVGYGPNGWIGHSEDWGYVYFTTDAFADVPASFTYSTDAFVACFLAGTRIATPDGEVPVEALAIGDRVRTADGRIAPVKWVGVQTVARPFADPLRTFPIRVAAGALGDALPVRDLLVSPDHALFLDGVLVQAAALVNGTTIVRETAVPERFTWFHVELADHSLILAEGVPAETFLDTVTRRRFDNWAEHEALYGDGGPLIAEIPAPRIKSARQLPRALRERLAARAAAWGAPADAVTDPGTRRRPVGATAGRRRFEQVHQSIDISALGLHSAGGDDDVGLGPDILRGEVSIPFSARTAGAGRNVSVG